MIISKPTFNIVSVEDAKLQVRACNHLDDEILETYIQAAQEIVENETRRSYRETTHQIKTDDFCIELRPANITNIESVTYLDTNGDLQTLSTDIYEIETKCFSRLRAQYNETFPYVLNHPDSITITYKTGYSNNSLIPSAVKSAVLLVVGDLFENREARDTSQYYMNQVVKDLLYTQKIFL